MGHQLVQKFNFTATHILSVPPTTLYHSLHTTHSLTHSPTRLCVCVVVARSFDRTTS
jgi:hypothetical protein